MAHLATLPLHGTLDLTRWLHGEDSVSLEHRLRRSALRGEPVAIGSAAAPYLSDRTEDAAARALLEACAGMAGLEGLEISITTRSARILRDLDLLAELDRRHAVTVDVALAAVDRELAWRLEGRESEPRARLDAIERLAEEGIAARVLWTPRSPGVNDTERALRRLFEGAVEAGACDVVAAGETPRPRRLLRSAEASGPGTLAVFQRLRLEHGFPRPFIGRG